MIVLHGIYKFWRKRVAFRNDYCLSCAQPRRAVQIRSFNVWHLFWVPLLPLGFSKPWLCATCGNDPHYGGTSRIFKWLGLFVLLFFGVFGWAAPSEPDAAVMLWIFRIGGPIGAILTLWHLIHTRASPTLAMQLAAIPPAADTVCPFCGTGLLVLGTQCCCPACGVARV